MKFWRWTISPIAVDNPVAAVALRIFLAMWWATTLLQGLIWFLRWLRTDVFI